MLIISPKNKKSALEDSTAPTHLFNPIYVCTELQYDLSAPRYRLDYDLYYRYKHTNFEIQQYIHDSNKTIIPIGAWGKYV